MLVLSRLRDETIVIGDNIRITVVDIRGDKVRLGIDAPTEIPVHRQEVCQQVAPDAARLGGEQDVQPSAFLRILRQVVALRVVEVVGGAQAAEVAP